MAIGRTSTSVTTYFGPNTTTFVSGFTISANVQLEIYWEESGWYYIEALGKRNYVPKASVTLLSGSVPIYYPTLLTRYTHTYGDIRFGPTFSHSGFRTLPAYENVYYLDGKKEGSFALVEYDEPAAGKRKRGWFEHAKLTATYSGPSRYRYLTGIYNNIDLHIIRIPASDIGLATLGGDKNLASSGYMGINGGFFVPKPASTGDPARNLNISVKNGVTVSTNGGGSISTVGASAIYWTGSALAWKLATNKTEISGISSNGTWAQGGISMRIGNTGWFSALDNEYLEVGYKSASSNGRTAMIADTTARVVYLIVRYSSQSKITMTTFRTAIQQFLDISDSGSTDHSRFKGLFLDGGGSSQLRCLNGSGSTVSIPGDGRSLFQIITV